MWNIFIQPVVQIPLKCILCRTARLTEAGRAVVVEASYAVYLIVLRQTELAMSGTKEKKWDRRVKSRQINSHDEKQKSKKEEGYITLYNIGTRHQLKMDPWQFGESLYERYREIFFNYIPAILLVNIVTVSPAICQENDWFFLLAYSPHPPNFILIFHVIKITYLEQNYHREQHYVRSKCVWDKCVHHY